MPDSSNAPRLLVLAKPVLAWKIGLTAV